MKISSLKKLYYFVFIINLLVWSIGAWSKGEIVLPLLLMLGCSLMIYWFYLVTVVIIAQMNEMQGNSHFNY